MAYYVDDGRGQFTEFESGDLTGAKELCQMAMESALAFKSRFGFIPFWGKATEIRQGRAGLALLGYGGEATNQQVVESTRLFKSYKLES